MADRAARHNLPVPHAPLIGREQVVDAVQQLLLREDVRLLTLIGPGGIGKTRLALKVAYELRNLFADSVYFVDLAPISDPALVIPTIAQALNLKEMGNQPLLDLLKTFLSEKQILLLLDNFEQVVSAAVEVADLLTASLGVKVLVTSRAVLHVREEQEFAVQPLSLPDPKHLPDLAALSQYEAVELFISRAQAVKPEFQVTDANAPAIAEICTHLDGLPLAIELAAARIKLLPPQALLARLGQRLAVLTSGARNAPTRHQTLRNTIKWSYDLLDAWEQRLFRRISVFVGGCMLEAVEEVCYGASDEMVGVLNTVASLIDKSLVQQREQETAEPRLTMLETIREYGLDCLRESGETDVSQRAHALYYLAFAEEAEPQLKGAQQVQWWKRLEREQENLRAALSWLIGQEEGELALRLSGALWWFWYTRGYWSEGWRGLESALGLPQAQGRTVRRAKALVGAAEFANLFEEAKVHSLIEESVAIYRELGDQRGLAEALAVLGRSSEKQNKYDAARGALEESVALAREVRDSWVLGNSLRIAGEFQNSRGEFKRARLCLDESATIYRGLHDKHSLSRTLRKLVDVLLSDHDMTQASIGARENLALARELDNWPDITRALYWLAVTQLWQSDAEQAVVLLKQSLALAREQGDKHQIGVALLTLGSISLYQEDLQKAEEYEQESLLLSKGLHNRNKEANAQALCVLGDIKRIQGDLLQARTYCTEGVLLAKELDQYSMGITLISLAKVATAEGQLEQATCLFGAAEPKLNPNSELDPFERADYEHTVESVRTQLGEKAFATLLAEGREMTLEQVLASENSLIIPPQETLQAPVPPAQPLPSNPAGLSDREVEVVRLVAQGFTNLQIAEKLIISAETVKTHVSNIKGKLKLDKKSRPGITSFAYEHRLV